MRLSPYLPTFASFLLSVCFFLSTTKREITQTLRIFHRKFRDDRGVFVGVILNKLKSKRTFILFFLCAHVRKFVVVVFVFFLLFVCFHPHVHHELPSPFLCPLFSLLPHHHHHHHHHHHQQPPHCFFPLSY